MSIKNTITKAIEGLYNPIAGFVIFEQQAGGRKKRTYVEHYDFDQKGYPINAHRLTVREAQRLVKSLDTEAGMNLTYLAPRGVMPANILHIHTVGGGQAIWYTPAQQRPLFFTENLGMPQGSAHVPQMVWCADKENLRVFSAKTTKRPRLSTPLYHAPFYNIYNNGRVCLGNIPVDLATVNSLEEFTTTWEGYFFNSYFSHYLAGHRTVEGDHNELWRTLMKSGNNFPKQRLIKSPFTLQNLIN